MFQKISTVVNSFSHWCSTRVRRRRIAINQKFSRLSPHIFTSSLFAYCNCYFSRSEQNKQYAQIMHSVKSVFSHISTISTSSFHVLFSRMHTDVRAIDRGYLYKRCVNIWVTVNRKWPRIFWPSQSWNIPNFCTLKMTTVQLSTNLDKVNLIGIIQSSREWCLSLINSELVLIYLKSSIWKTEILE